MNRVKPWISNGMEGKSLHVVTVAASDNRAQLPRISGENEPVSDSRTVKVAEDTPGGATRKERLDL